MTELRNDKTPKARLSAENLINLLTSYTNEYCSNCQHRALNLSVFLGALFIVLCGIIQIIALSINIYVQAGLIMLSGAMLAFLANILFNMYKQDYNSFLEIIVKMGIVEEILEINNSQFYHGKKWSTDSLVSYRHIATKEEFNNAKDFIEAKLKRGQMMYVHRLTVFVYVLSGIIFTYGMLTIFLKL